MFDNIMKQSKRKHLNLHSPYSKLTDMLWQSKTVLTLKQSQSKILKSKLAQHSKPIHVNPLKCIDQIPEMLTSKYNRLTEKAIEQRQWIRDAQQMIEERKYQRMRRQVERIEENIGIKVKEAKQLRKKVNKMNRLRQKREEKQKLDDKQNRDREMNVDPQMRKDTSQPPIDTVIQYSLPSQRLTNQQRELDALFQYKLQQLSSSKINLAYLQKEVLQLLNAKNSIRKEIQITKLKTWREGDEKKKTPQKLRPNRGNHYQQFDKVFKYKSHKNQ